MYSEFLRIKRPREIRKKNEITPFYFINYAENIGKIVKVLGTRIETIYNFRTPDQLRVRA